MNKDNYKDKDVTFTTNADGSISYEATRELKFYPNPSSPTIAYGEGKDRRLETFSPIVQRPKYVEVQDVGENKFLQRDMTEFFHRKVLKWILTYPQFAHLKKHYNFLKTTQGMEYIYNLLKLFVRKSAANWYDLNDPHNYPIVKDFLRFKIGAV